jgi:nucleotide-binding universal stress UspA family protein
METTDEVKTAGRPQAQPRIQKQNNLLQTVDSSIICALEGVTEENDTVERMREALMAWKGPRQKIQPVTVLSALDMAWPLRLTAKQRKQLMNRAEEKIQSLLEKNGIVSEKAKLLESKVLSIRKMAETLAGYAKKEKAEVLIVGTGANTKEHWTGLGSFAETLIALSKVPVMVLGRHLEASSKISKIFFPTDLSPESKKIFKTVLMMAKKYGAEVILFHHFDPQLGPLMLGPYGVGVDTSWVDRYWQKQKQLGEDTGRKWERAGSKSGVRCTYVPDYQFGNLSDRMLETIGKSKSDLIMVGLKRGPMSQVIFGRVVRELFSQAKKPVIVVHQELKK